jgi:hypothetical protein
MRWLFIILLFYLRNYFYDSITDSIGTEEVLDYI